MEGNFFKAYLILQEIAIKVIRHQILKDIGSFSWSIFFITLIGLTLFTFGKNTKPPSIQTVGVINIG